MKLAKIILSAVIGTLIDPEGFGLVDSEGSILVFAGPVGTYLLTSTRRDTNLLASI